MAENTPTRARRGSRTAVAVALVAAGALGGGVLAGTLSASADTATGTSSAAASQYGAATDTQGRKAGGANAHGSASVRSDEKELTGTDAEKAKAAALAAVPGGTVYRVETDAGDGEYEAHMTKADGTEVTVKLDANFAVIEVQDGMGKGDPAPAGAQDGQQSGGTAPSDAPSASATN
jgi:uncharacterized membrane protein YkoI